jgi:hypothetical protein
MRQATRDELELGINPSAINLPAFRKVMSEIKGLPVPTLSPEEQALMQEQMQAMGGGQLSESDYQQLRANFLNKLAGGE